MLLLIRVSKIVLFKTSRFNRDLQLSSPWRHYYPIRLETRQDQITIYLLIVHLSQVEHQFIFLNDRHSIKNGLFFTKTQFVSLFKNVTEKLMRGKSVII